MVDTVTNGKCVACKTPLEAGASVCPSCGTNQATWLRYLNMLSNPVSFLISVAAAAISIFAYAKSNEIVVANPTVELQIIDFAETGFKFFVYNRGDAPTVLGVVDLDLLLMQDGGAYRVEASFDLVEPITLIPGAVESISLSYDAYSPTWTRWVASVPPPNDPFTVSFLYGAAGLGNNLDCRVSVLYSKSGYYDNVGEYTAGTNGNCAYAMKWFAENIGPLAANQ